MDIWHRKFLVDVTPPIVQGVTDGGTYGKVTITFDEGTSTLNGNAFLSGSQISATGLYHLNVTDRARNSTICDFSIIIYGDVSGDGLIDISDLSAIKKHLLKINLLDSVYKKAAEISTKGETGDVSISDLLLIKKHILGLVLINNN